MKKFKTGIFFLICTNLLTNMAQAYWHDNWLGSAQGNWVVGATGSYSERLGNEDIALFYTNPVAMAAGFPSSFIIEDYTDTGFIWGVFAGYQARCHRWLFGGEVNVDWDHIDEDHPFAFADAFGTSGNPLGLGWNASTRYKRGTTVGLTARVGYAISSGFMPFARIGIESSMDQLKTVFVANSPAYGLGVNTFGTCRQYRFVGGVGAEMPLPLYAGFTLRLEYNFHSKGKGVQAIGVIVDNLGYSPEFMSIMMPRMHSGKVSLVFNF